MQQDKIILLLSKQFSGDASPEELSALREWLAASEANRAYAAEIERIWQQSEQYHPDISFDPEADFSRIEAGIRPAKRLYFSGFWRAAAAVALLLGAFWAWNGLGSGKAETLILADAGTQKEILLPDGSKVWLRPGASLSYSPDWSENARRLVQLTGEAWFEVVRRPEQPFAVQTAQGAVVEVLGTTFDVAESEEDVKVLVRTGKVRFTPLKNGEGCLLTAGQKAVFHKKGRTVKTETPDTYNELAWHTGGLEFVNTPLSSVVKDLERYYNAKISLSNPALENCPYSAPLTNQPLPVVLNTLSIVYNLTVHRSSEGIYELKGGNCR